MRTLLCCIICLLLLAGCAGTTTTVIPDTSSVATKAAAIKAKVGKLTTIAGKATLRLGPFLTAGVCVGFPAYCGPAKIAYNTARVTINSIEAAKAAGDGPKVIALAEELGKNMDTINSVLAATGQEKIDLTEFRTTVQELQTVAAQ